MVQHMSHCLTSLLQESRRTGNSSLRSRDVLTGREKLAARVIVQYGHGMGLDGCHADRDYDRISHQAEIRDSGSGERESMKSARLA